MRRGGEGDIADSLWKVAKGSAMSPVLALRSFKPQRLRLRRLQEWRWHPCSGSCFGRRTDPPAPFAASAASSVLFRRLERVHRRPVILAERRDDLATVCPDIERVCVAGDSDVFSFGTPAPAKRSITLLSTPHVIGLMKPSGGGGAYAELIFRICATSVGSPGNPVSHHDAAAAVA